MFTGLVEEIGQIKRWTAQEVPAGLQLPAIKCWKARKRVTVSLSTEPVLR